MDRRLGFESGGLVVLGGKRTEGWEAGESVGISLIGGYGKG